MERHLRKAPCHCSGKRIVRQPAPAGPLSGQGLAVLDSGMIFVTLQCSVLQEDGRFAHFLFVTMDLQVLLEATLAGLGYELVDLERSGKGRLLRVFIDKPGGVNVDDCAAVSHHLSRVLTVEGVAYDRLEVSSPGLDRLLKKERDFVRFAGQRARIKLRIPVDGQRNFIGVLRETRAGKVQLEIDGKLLSLDLENLEKARLVPAI
jgi:ribosome maturation factor RimP